MKEHLYLKDEQIKDFIEKIFYAYREIYSDPKKVLNEYSLGLAHLKSLNLISKFNEITISQLKITKQSLNRVLRDLKKIEVINYKKDLKDYRVKHVILTEKGKDLTNKIFIEQKKRIYKALQNSNSQAVLNFDSIIKKIING